MQLSVTTRRLRPALLMALSGLMVALGPRLAAAADEVPVRLLGVLEVPPVETRASATGTISVDADGTITGSILTTGMDGTMAHIHVGAEGENGPPIITLTKAHNTYTVPSGSTLTEAQMANFDNEELYVNVHSAAWPNGEIRAQLER